MSDLQTLTVRQQLGRRLVKGLEKKLGLTEVQCYRVAQAMPVEGMVHRTVQVAIGGGKPDGAGDGGQWGGGLVRSVNVKITLWNRSYLDERGHTQEALQEAADGLDDFLESIRAALAMTTLGGLLIEPMRWKGETDPELYDQEMGWLRQDLTYEAVCGEALPVSATLVAADVV